ncbi:MAG: right-handed parallel beta-helix repeat-containing protein [Bacteroidales bacterium]
MRLSAYSLRSFCLLPVVFVFLLLPNGISAQNVYLDSTTTVVNSSNAPVSGGDTIFLQSGTYEFLLFKGIRGDSQQAVTITNDKGEVIIDSDHYFGISFQNCRHIHLSGQTKYGIRITKVENGGGIGISALSSHFEIDRVEIANTLHAGIMCKTDPDCSYKATRDSFLMKDIHIHDNYIHHTGTEGLYIGSSNFFGNILKCEGKDTLLLPHLIEGVHIHGNIIKYTGWDGLQVSSAIDNCAIYNNRILYDSQAEQNFQMSGILSGSGSDCDCYNNLIAYGKGNGIEFHGTGGQRFFNNLIIHAGQQYKPGDPKHPRHGMVFNHQVFLSPDSSIRVFNNTIIKPKSDGIRFNLSDYQSAENFVQNNIIVSPGAFDYYENLNTFRTGQDAYVFQKDTGLDVTVSDNIFTLDPAFPQFLDTLADNYTLRPGSPAIDQGTDLSAHGILFDYYYTARPQGPAFDIGAFEFDSLTVGQKESAREHHGVFPNPASDFFMLKTTGPHHIRVFSPSGNLLLQKKNAAPGERISIRQLKPGLYFLQLQHTSSHAVNTLKLIIL